MQSIYQLTKLDQNFTYLLLINIWLIEIIFQFYSMNELHLDFIVLKIHFV